MRILNHYIRFTFLSFASMLILTCEDNKEDFGSIKVEIAVKANSDSQSGQNARTTGINSNNIGVQKPTKAKK